MKDDYIWDKTGDDPEIKQLENVLAVLRYRETAAPALPAAKVVPLVEKTTHRRFSFAFAFAACSAVVILLGVWFQVSSGKAGSEKGVALTTPPQINSETRDESGVDKINDSRVEEVENAKPTTHRSLVNVRRFVPLARRQNRTIAKTFDNKKSVVTLTSEEKYAYGQLMLALSITSSKLKIVQDTINGMEGEKNTVTKDNP